MTVALVGASPVLAALRARLGAQCTLAVARTTADHIAQVADTAVLDLPAGESREFVRALGARNIRVLDLGPDLRIPQVPCVQFAPDGWRVAAMPSPGAVGAFFACFPLMLSDVIHPGGLVALADAPDLGWLLGQAGQFAAVRLLQIPIPPANATATVIGDVGNRAHDTEAIAEGYEKEGVRFCGPGIQPDVSRVKGTATVELSVHVSEFAEFVVAICALDPVSYVAAEAFRVLRQMAA
ncbi:MAG TPA: hypothetical protein VLW85_10660 [Myxococcales bacterium]|nr:hypothetical protein [Myxococcales bacterium]